MGTRDGICKLLKSPGIDSANLCSWRAGTTTLPTQFLAPIDCLKILALSKFVRPMQNVFVFVVILQIRRHSNVKSERIVQPLDIRGGRYQALLLGAVELCVARTTVNTVLKTSIYCEERM